jgi:flavin reductase (DIM6/NTAB) family NADH-FMN oxidoreductase RutF
MIYTASQIADMERRYRTTFINSVSGFKSLQMVATFNEAGLSNIALFNSIFHVGANPPLLGMVVRPDGANHQTLDNIKQTRQYTLNNVLPQWYQRAHQTSARYEANSSEFVECGFTKYYIEGFNAPFIKESSIGIGLQLHETLDVAINGTTIVIGEIKYLRFAENTIIGDYGYVDLEQAGSVTVNGLDSYHTTQTLGRLPYAKPGKYPEPLGVNNKVTKTED